MRETKETKELNARLHEKKLHRFARKKVDHWNRESQLNKSVDCRILLKLIHLDKRMRKARKPSHGKPQLSCAWAEWPNSVVCGYVKPGTMTALMGASCAGK